MPEDSTPAEVVSVPVGRVVGGRTEVRDDDWGAETAIIRLDAGQYGPEAVADYTAAVRAVAPDAAVAVDEEGGDVTRLHVADGSPVLGPLALVLGANGVERALLLGSCLLVLAAELLNSAIEAVIERYGAEHHELAGRAKDMGSAAVFVMMINAVLTWAFVLWPHFAA